MFTKIKEKIVNKADMLFKACDLDGNNYIDPIEYLNLNRIADKNYERLDKQY